VLIRGEAHAVAVAPVVRLVGEPPDGEQIVGVEQRERVVARAAVVGDTPGELFGERLAEVFTPRALGRPPREVLVREGPAEGTLVDATARRAAAAFLEGYLAELGKTPVRLLPASPAWRAHALSVFELDKALYEVRYEVDNRPAWLAIPLRGLTRLLARERAAS